jgi:hypothetical protein
MSGAILLGIFACLFGIAVWSGGTNRVAIASAMGLGLGAYWLGRLTLTSFRQGHARAQAYGPIATAPATTEAVRVYVILSAYSRGLEADDPATCN